MGLAGGQVAQHGAQVTGAAGGSGSLHPGSRCVRLRSARSNATSRSTQPRYQSRIGSPTRMAVMRAGGEERPERDAGPCASGACVTIEHDADHRAVEEAEEQAEHDLAPPEPAEGQAEHERRASRRRSPCCAARRGGARRRPRTRRRRASRPADDTRRGRRRPSAASASSTTDDDRQRVHDPVRQQVVLEVDRPTARRARRRARGTRAAPTSRSKRAASAPNSAPHTTATHHLARGRRRAAALVVVERAGDRLA